MPALQFTTPVQVNTTRGWNEFSAEDLNYAVKVIYSEAKNNPTDQYAVASVLWNRIDATGVRGGVQSTFTGVSNAPRQFAGVGSDKFNGTNFNAGEYNSAFNQVVLLLGDSSGPGATYNYNQFLSYPAPGYEQLVPGGNYYYNNPGIKGPNNPP